MAIALVSAGAVSISAVAAGTVTPAFGAATTAGHLLLCCATCQPNSGGSGANLATSAGGWSSALSANGYVQIFYKPNCGAGETAPTITGNNGAADKIYAVLSEWSGAATSTPLDKTGLNTSGASSPKVIAASASDTYTNDLAVVVYDIAGNSKSATMTPTDTWTPGGTTGTVGSTGSTKDIQWFYSAYAIQTAGGTAADQDSLSWTVSTGTGSSALGGIASFKDASPISPSVSVTALPQIFGA